MTTEAPVQHPPSLSRAELREQVARLSWWHRIDLGHGVITPGTDDSPAKLARLDVGAWDGFFSFEAERRGAARVVAIDESWRGHEGGPTKQGFNLARRVLGSRVEDRNLSVYDLDSADLGRFDLVLFLGVLYHLRHPLLALERLHGVAAGSLILETELDCTWSRRPRLAFYPGSELNADGSNWFAPNRSALLALVQAAGFISPRVTYETPFLRKVGRAIKHRRLHGTAILHTLERARCVLHASV
jgi:tRNA (mo5U34)-methyltransferase